MDIATPVASMRRTTTMAEIAILGHTPAPSLTSVLVVRVRGGMGIVKPDASTRNVSGITAIVEISPKPVI
jgi:hypothetical protein